MIPAFSPAIASSVSPSISVWSSPIDVMTRQRGHDHVGGVEPPAEADLDHRPLDARARRSRRTPSAVRDLEERAVRGPPGSARCARAGARQPRLVGPLAVDADALAEVDQVRRGEEPGAQPGRAQHALDQRAHRALAVRAGDVHRAEARSGRSPSAPSSARVPSRPSLSRRRSSPYSASSDCCEAHVGRRGSCIGRGRAGAGRPRRGEAAPCRAAEAAGRAPEELEQAADDLVAHLLAVDDAVDEALLEHELGALEARAAAPRRWSGG